ncbi:YtpR family tRNA-binding protein [Mangrovibacillus cuniculi]|uniref:DUF4479 domain-containing protein n=1 Tax=Mangrovibacillus cuniculi TaxID=2593652 RepID=A0A7S8HGW4_9BACI|nr:DUF4479 family protein [Mangrovibacillus cuniculi]QPC48424.1 DUF4479 domain-containing protein [Mangrovibacillus cuniculi]
MHMFYNKEGIGDVLLATSKEVGQEKVHVDRKGNVARVIETSSNETIGYNIFEVSFHLSLEANGQVELTEELVNQVNELIKAEGFEDLLVADLSPKFVVGHVVEKEKHPNADKLSVCQVDLGDEKVQIVCGAPNVEAGQKVVVAKVGAVMPSGMLIKDAELRGLPSSGMICSARELAIPNAPEVKGILVLGDDAVVGTEFPVGK